MNYCTLKF